MKAADEFVSNAEVIERIKDILSTKVGNKKVFDKDVAEFIGINQYSLASAKKKKLSHILQGYFEDVRAYRS